MSPFAYLHDRYMIFPEGQEFIVLIPFIAAILFSIALYYFTKNKWGSILVSPLVTVVLSAFALKYVIHLYFIILSFVITWIFVNMAEKNK
ncbi:hypothetical protein ACFWM3_24945 [Gottfriedia sp. NPDC058432]|uniref:hypothetical protein n=1 Tax=Gottfriedia sp. NPDC058432 TaxID=3346497 RepID=UPI003656F03F